CRVYVMTSWPRFLFHAAPWHWRALLVVTLPFWYRRVSHTWQVAGGWSQQFGRRRAVGVKPPRLLEQADRSIGERIFVRERDLNEKVQHVTCHELTHAFAAHLRLPMWLNEGLAMVTVDRFAGEPTVQHATLETLRRASPQGPGRYRQVRADDGDALVYHVVRGYWLTRYVLDTRPGLILELLEQRQRHRELEDRLAAAYEMGYDEFWQRIDGLLVAHLTEEES
ncbi:MAG: hypothetical protein KJ734_02930, partial [Chloroflexi bacterium]|nr:hypothetical protein [Chloroflexota bacterium]